MPPSTPTLPHCPDLPPLPTLDLRPSWCNARGHIDRSACIEIRVSEARELAGCVPHKARTRNRKRRRIRAAMPYPYDSATDGFTPESISTERACVSHGFTPESVRSDRGSRVLPLPHEKPARNGRGRVASGVLTITAHQLHHLHQHRPPRLLAGDFRTARANAMRPAHWKRGRHGGRFRCRIDRKNPVAWPAAHNLDGNPNKGATREKMIGLPRDWTQPVRMEMWQFPKRIRPAYYFVCPSHIAPGLPGVDAHRCRSATPGKPGALCDPRLAPLSTCKPGRKAKGCPQRCLKLMMVQCTAAEHRDAKIAQTWIDSIPPPMIAKMRPHIHRLIERYGPIFEPRVLLCPRCVGGRGVKYGNNPETIRQGWRRRHNKPETTFAASGVGGLHAVPVHMNFLARQEYEHQRERRAYEEAGGTAAVAAAHPAIAAERAERRRTSQRAYYRRNAKRINRETVERRRRRRRRHASRGVLPR